jgi:hypothetical protein
MWSATCSHVPNGDDGTSLRNDKTPPWQGSFSAPMDKPSNVLVTSLVSPDAPSDRLYQYCAPGKHYRTAVLVD